MGDADKEVIRIILQSGNGTEWKVDALDALMQRDKQERDEARDVLAELLAASQLMAQAYAFDKTERAKQHAANKYGKAVGKATMTLDRVKEQGDG